MKLIWKTTIGMLNNDVLLIYFLYYYYFRLFLIYFIVKFKNMIKIKFLIVNNKSSKVLDELAKKIDLLST